MFVEIKELFIEGKPDCSVKTEINSVQKSAGSKHNQSVYRTERKAIYYISNPTNRRPISNLQGHDPNNLKG